MRFLTFCKHSLIALIVLSIYSCDKTTIEEFKSDSLNEYIPLSVGKYITYRIDSTVFTNFGRVTEIHKYQVKHVIDAQISDNLGRPSFRIFRYLNDSIASKSWVPAGSYFITPLSTQIEVIEDNLRFIKLHLPIKNGYKWKGNKYIPANAYGALYNFSNDDSMEEWDFEYDGESTSFSFGGKNYTGVYSVKEEDEAFNVPITDPNGYASKTKAVEKYSKSIGLVYREYEMWEYQPNPGGQGGPFKTGFGIKMWMIDHN